MNNDLISREALKKEIQKELDKADLSEYEACICVTSIYDRLIDNAPTALFPLTVRINDNVTDEDIENLKQLMKAYKPQFLNLETERPQGELAEKLKERIAESVCKYCQMNRHCELCEISRVFSIIALTNEEMKGGAE